MVEIDATLKNKMSQNYLFFGMGLRQGDGILELEQPNKTSPTGGEVNLKEKEYANEIARRGWEGCLPPSDVQGRLFGFFLANSWSNKTRPATVVAKVLFENMFSFLSLGFGAVSVLWHVIYIFSWVGYGF